MTFATDFTKVPEQIVIDLINDANVGQFVGSYPMTTALIGFSDVTVLDGNEYTSVLATAKPGSGFQGTQTLSYNRINLATIPGVRSKVFQVGDAANLSELAEEISLAYGINLTADDFVEAVIPAFPELAPHETQEINLVAKAGSLVFTGSLTLTLNANDLDLSDVLQVTNLDGLVYVQPV